LIQDEFQVFHFNIRSDLQTVLADCIRVCYSEHIHITNYRLKKMDIVYLNDLRIDTIIGIYDWERRTRQTVILDIEMGTDIKRAAETDSIENTLDYKAVAKRLFAYVGESEFNLVETLAERIATLLLEEFRVPWCRVRLNKKGAVRGVRDVGVIIERGNKS